MFASLIKRGGEQDDKSLEAVSFIKYYDRGESLKLFSSLLLINSKGRAGAAAQSASAYHQAIPTASIASIHVIQALRQKGKPQSARIHPGLSARAERRYK